MGDEREPEPRFQPPFHRSRCRRRGALPLSAAAAWLSELIAARGMRRRHGVERIDEVLARHTDRGDEGDPGLRPREKSVGLRIACTIRRPTPGPQSAVPAVTTDPPSSSPGQGPDAVNWQQAPGSWPNIAEKHRARQQSLGVRGARDAWPRAGRGLPSMLERRSRAMLGCRCLQVASTTAGRIRLAGQGRSRRWAAGGAGRRRR